MNSELFIQEILPFQDSLYKLALYILESESDASDALQEVYLKLWKMDADTLLSLSNPKAYCFSIMKNYCLDVLRRRNAHSEEKVEDVLEAQYPASASDEPQSRYEAAESLALIHSLLNTLSPNERQVLVLRAFEGRDYEEIETLCGMSYLSLRVHLSNARRKIRKALKSMEL